MGMRNNSICKLIEKINYEFEVHIQNIRADAQRHLSIRKSYLPVCKGADTTF